ncbi:MAG: Type 1 glutamine amidotransferase-like domain-containing protein [Clostridia bacterium]|nr:Type 1 glutamine amidotransferase-like domain-containing protein [Clostridia bacterium]
MVNILLDYYDIDSPWLFDSLKRYIKPHHKVAVIAFSFRESRVKNLSDWDFLYGGKSSRFYSGLTGALSAYGIKEENIQFLNYFTDTKETAAEKIRSADILYFLGGLPDKMYERLKEFDLLDVIMKHNGIVMGYSAGAVIQLAQYHLSPDDDYPALGYYEGLPMLRDFYIEVHYENTDIQNAAIKSVLKEKKKTVYAFSLGKGAIIAENGEIQLLGDVKTFKP